MTDTSKYQKLFLEEATEHLQNLNTLLLEFEKKPDPKLAQEMMRSCHTIKGSAASMGYGQIADLAHSLEDQFEKLKAKGVKVKIDELFGIIDELEAFIKETQKQKNTKTKTGGEIEGEELARRPEAFAPITTIKVGVEKLDQLMNLVEELLVNRMRLGQIETNKNWPDLPAALDSLDRLISDLQYNVMEARLVPVDQIFNRFPRMVRDLAKKEEKKVELRISGSEIELDRTLLNQIGEPLVHLLRNAVDHGIEKKGVIKLSARREKGMAVIEVEDDGKGIDYEKLKIKNEKLKITDKNVKLEDLLFAGISTNEHVTKVSGRGVGLTVVKTKVEEVGGKVDVESPVAAIGRGARFTLELPLTLAIAQALLVKTGGEKFAIPVADVDRLVRLKHSQIKKTADMEAAVIADEDVPLVRLADLFGLPTTYRLSPITPDILAILAKVQNQTIGFIVDEVLSEQDIIIKPLTGLLREQKGLSGVTILGDGGVVLILDIARLIEIKNQK